MTSDSISPWLQIREPADVAARSEALTRAIADALPAGQPLRLLDLGTGTGSNIRYLAPRLRGEQHWVAIDRNALLLTQLAEQMSAWAEAAGYEWSATDRCCLVRGPHFECHIETRERELGTLNDHQLFARHHLVTASALFDLVSEAWLRSLAGHCREEGALALFAITYNGRFTCTPAEPEDDAVRDLMNRHQGRDKGLGGPAAGPDGALAAERCFAQTGYRVRREPSDWKLDSVQRDVQRLLIDGWAQAAAETAPNRATAIADWRARRLAHVDAGRSGIVVSHDDLAAWPPESMIRTTPIE